MFHLSAFQASIANGSVLIQINAEPDAILPASGLGLLSSGLTHLHAIGFVGATLVRGQFQAPSLRDYGNLDVEPINLGTTWESPPRLRDFSMRPIPLAQSEEWDMFAANSGAGNATENGFLWSSDRRLDPFPPKKIVQVRWTAAATLTANTWSLIQLTLSQPLYPGMYALVGSHMKSATALAHRFVPAGNPQGAAWRPGGMSVQAVDSLDHPGQRQGLWGKWLDFTNTTVPQMEVFATAADTSEEGIIDLVPY
jgi:hypothetical protein